MAEIVSKQAAVVAAGSKNLAPKMGGGTKRCVVITSPDTATWAENDTIASPIKVPKGSRFLCDTFVSHADMGTSITLDIGIRAVDGTVIDVDGICDGLDVATAANRQAANNGVLVAAGAEYITTQDCYVYATLLGGTPTANAQLRIEVSVLFPF